MSKKSTQIIVSSIILGGLIGIGASTWYYLNKKNKGLCSYSFFNCHDSEEIEKQNKKS